MKKYLLLFLIVCLKPAKAQKCFSTFNIMQYSNPTAVCTADFNGDGLKDLASSNHSADSVLIYLGTGAGTFNFHTGFPVGTNPYAIIDADFNNDGYTDLATANSNLNNVSVLLGNGTGIFGPATSYSVGQTPQSLTSADFDNDGFKDLAVANNYSNSVSLLMGTGTGTFGTATNLFAGGSYPSSIISADFNADGKFDLAVATGVGAVSKVYVFKNTGGGVFSSPVGYTVGDKPLGVIAVDVNNDNKLDLVTANQNGKSISVLAGTGTGIFTAPTNISLGSFQDANSLVSADFNRDGKADVATTNYHDYSITVLTGNGAYGFVVDTTITLFASGAPWNIVSADFNGDTIPDLAVANYGSANVEIFLSCNSQNGLVDLNKNSSIYVYPNPATDHLLVETSQGENMTLGLYDVKGMRIFRIDGENKSTIDVTNLDNGVYTLSIKTVSGIINRKIVVLH